MKVYVCEDSVYQKEEIIPVCKYLEENKVVDELFLLLWNIKDDSSALIMQSFAKNKNLTKFTLCTEGTKLFAQV